MAEAAMGVALAAFMLVVEMRVNVFLRRRRAAERRRAAAGSARAAPAPPPAPAARARPRTGNVRLLDDARRPPGEAG